MNGFFQSEGGNFGIAAIGIASKVIRQQFINQSYIWWSLDDI